MYKLQAIELENVRGGSKAGAVVKGVKVGYGVLAKSVEVAGVLAATADLAYRGYRWVRGRHD